MKFIIVDIDGTLADYQHRLHYIHHRQGDPRDGDGKDWDGFNRAALNDPPYREIVELVNLYAEEGTKVVLMTGRSARFMDITVRWLHHHGVRHHMLLMRKAGDFRSDTVVKKELYEQLVADPRFGGSKPLFILEDRDKVVEMWRSMGLRCLQVQKGDY